MKGGMDIFCASQAATAICNAMEKGSSSSMVLSKGGTSPAIDRYNPIIRDPARAVAKSLFIPKSHHKKAQKKKKKTPLTENGDNVEMKVAKQQGRKSWSCTRPGDFISPPGSARYLLSDDKAYFNQPDESSIDEQLQPQNQVVVLRVSLHCRGCEKKMRKHISRMEGVKSFSIDFAAKKVTVSGNITPMEVLSSISKVKNAQLWPPSTAPNLGWEKNNGINGNGA